jgi:hypothetical protein
VLDTLPNERIAALRAALPGWLDGQAAGACRALAASGELDETTRTALVEAVRTLAATQAAPAGAIP